MIGLLLIAAGAILVWAVHVSSQSVNLHTIGVILMVVGIIEALIEATWWLYFRRVWRGMDNDRPLDL